MFRSTARWCLFLVLACSLLPLSAFAQQGASNAVVPMLVNYSGVLNGTNGKPLTGTVGVTFALYPNQEGGAPLWLETQNVQLDKTGHYSVQLGAASKQGLPPSVFAAGEARWLGVQPQGQEEQPRTLLMSVPYALKALDAETIGGKPASSFMLAPAAGKAGVSPNSQASNITGSGTADFIPKFTGTTTIGNSKIYQNASNQVGINTTSPAANLDVKGTTDVRDTLTLFPKGSHPTLSINGTAFKVSNTGTVTFVSGQTFPGTGTITGVTAGAGLSGGGSSGNVTLSVPSSGITNAMLQHSSLTVGANSPLTGGGSVSLGGSTSLGLKSCSSNQILEYNGSSWVCVNIPVGTITGVTAGTGLSGGGSSGNVTVGINTSVVPQLAAVNAFTNNNAISVNSGSPDLSLGNAGSGDGIDISLTSGVGVDVFSGDQGMHATTSGDAGVFEGGFDGSYNLGPVTGVWSESDTDSNFNAGLWGYEGGSTTETIGVEGYSASPAGYGVYGQDVAGNTLSGAAVATGVWGDSSAAAGVIGFSDSFVGVGAQTADSSGSGVPAMLAINITSTAGDPVVESYGSGVGGLCVMDTSGDLSCSGSKSAVVPVDGGSRKVALYAIEGPENWFEDAGSAHLSNGEAVVNLEGTFGQTVNTEMEYHVFLTPSGDCKGLYVAQKSPTSFVVRELGGGTSSIDFDYRIMAKRKGYENIRLEDRTRQFRKPLSLSRNNAAGPSVKAPSAQETREKHQAGARRMAQLSKPHLSTGK